MSTHAATPSPTTDATLDGARAWFRQHGLVRPRDGRLLAGVSEGFARRFAVNRLVARVATVAVALTFTPLAYVGLWVLMPSE